MNTLLSAIFYFAIYSFGGWIAQGIYVGFKKRHFVNTGFLYGPWVPIYGFGALIILYVVKPITDSWIGLFLVTFFLCSVLEYFTSWAMQKLFHRLWWDYSKRPFNIHGRVCLLNSTLYGIGGIVVAKFVQPEVLKLQDLLTLKELQGFDILFLLVFGTDLVCTLVHMLHTREALHAVHAHIQELHKMPVPERVQAIHNHLQENIKKLETDRHLKAFPNAKLNETFSNAISEAKKHLS